MKKILIVSPNWLGDAIMADSLYQCLKAKHAPCSITIICPEPLVGLHQVMATVDTVIGMPIQHGQFGFWQRRAMGHSLRTQHYDQAYILPNSWKSALIPWFAKIPHRTGWLGEHRYGLLNDHRQLNKADYPLMVQRLVALSYEPNETWNKTEYPYPQLICPQKEAQTVLEKYQPRQAEKGENAISTAFQSPDRRTSGESTGMDKLVPEDKATLVQQRRAKKGEGCVGLCPGAAYGPSKRWPIRYFAQVANALIDQGQLVWIFGSTDDRAICNEINRLTDDRCVNFAGQTSLVDALHLLSLTNCVITNDSGLMHVAAALDKRLVAIFGSSSPGFTPPLSDKATILSQDNLSCKPCFKRECPLPQNRLRCLKAIKPEQVLQALVR